MNLNELEESQQRLSNKPTKHNYFSVVNVLMTILLAPHGICGWFTMSYKPVQLNTLERKTIKNFSM